MRQSAYPLITAPCLKGVLEDGKNHVVIIDVRSNLVHPEKGREAYLESHIPGAVFADMETDVAGVKTGTNGRHPFPDLETFAEKMRSFGVRKDTFVILYDGGEANFASRLWFTFRAAGHGDIRVLNGGVKAWVDAGLPVTKEIPTPIKGDFEVGEPLERVFTKEEIEKNLESGEYLLVDARSNDRFHGKNETMDPKGGHIPGAFNHPSAANIGPDGYFLRKGELKEGFKAVLDAAAGKPIINYCGSGVTACCNHLAMEDVGIQPAGVYIGSWSEWIADPKHPLATE